MRDPAGVPVTAAGRRDGDEGLGVVDADRLRLLAALGGSVVHELANRLSAASGFAEDLQTKVDPVARAPLDRSLAAARESLALLRVVVRLLDRQPRDLVPVALRAVAEEAALLVRKHAAGSATAIEVVPGPDACVRVGRAELLQAIATGILFALRSHGEGPLRLTLVERRSARAAIGLSIGDRGELPQYAALAAALAAAPTDAAVALRRVIGGADSLLALALVLRRHGGDLAVECAAPPQRALVLWLPAVSPP